MQTIQQILNFSVGKLTVGNIASAIVIYIICHMVISSLSGTINKLIAKINKDENLQGFLKTVVNVMLHFVAMCIVAEAVGIPISSLLAVLGMLGLAISLSVQGALSNVANGIMLLLTKPFTKGQYVNAAGVEGIVEEVSLLVTKIKTLDNKDIFIPNTEIASGKITNFSSEDLRRVDIDVRAGYNNEVADVLKSLNEAIAMTPNALKDPAPFCRLSGYYEYSVQYTLRVWCKNENYWDVYFDLLENISKCHAKNGINGGVPSMNVNMVNK
ncbi:MAG: mechanosensitive ion channel family protein [Phascolarctobacterium sp.]|nr:mechanosensitive ion channel family protein [Phascolarctobacterium sp.]